MLKQVQLFLSQNTDVLKKNPTCIALETFYTTFLVGWFHYRPRWIIRVLDVMQNRVCVNRSIYTWSLHVCLWTDGKSLHYKIHLRTKSQILLQKPRATPESVHRRHTSCWIFKHLSCFQWIMKVCSLYVDHAARKSKNQLQVTVITGTISVERIKWSLRIIRISLYGK